MNRNDYDNTVTGKVKSLHTSGDVIQNILFVPYRDVCLIFDQDRAEEVVRGIID